MQLAYEASDRVFEVGFRLAPGGDDTTFEEARRLLTAYLGTYAPQGQPRASRTARARAKVKKAAPEPPKASRRDRVSQALLSKPRSWLTVAEIADLTEQGDSDTAARNATSDLLRRMTSDGHTERDDRTRPVRYKAVPAALRKHLAANA